MRGIYLLMPALICALPAYSAETADRDASVYTSPKPAAIISAADRALEKAWRDNDLLPVYEASDFVMVRRLYLDLAGRLPAPAEVRAYVSDRSEDKYVKLADELLSSPGFVSLWSMRFGDMLRVKSEFPINLWPNAVYVYMRRIQEFLRNDEPYDRFVRELLLSSGSNFRDPAVNFYRAHADRSPRGIAGNVLMTLCGIKLENLSGEEQRSWEELFSEICFKSTKEWKEEIVYRRSMPERTLILPGGGRHIIPAGENGCRVLADFLTSGEGRKLLASAMADRAWRWFFGAGLLPEGDAPGNAELLDKLAEGFIRRDFSFRHLCRMIVLSAAYRSASFQPDAAGKAPYFAAYPVRRLEAEVLDDVISDICGSRSRYTSVIPEPFTFIPPDMRTVEIADGSISSSFLILFGRPSRDTGMPFERNDRINAKQRLFLFNSGALYRRLQDVPRRNEVRKLKPDGKIEYYYLLFYSRPPTRAERKILEAYRKTSGKKRSAWENDLMWTLVNSAEFLHRH